MAKKNTTPNLIDNAKKIADDAKSAGRSVYLASLGAYATAEEETRGFFDRLVDKGRTYDASRTDYVKLAADKVRNAGQTVEDKVQSTVSGTLHRVGVPSRDEIRTLISRVETLTKKVESMSTVQ